MEQSIKNILQLTSFAVLLIVSSTLGFLSHPTEMGLSILAGALGLGFCNIERIARFKAAGFEAEMRMLQTTINAQIEPTTEAQDKAKESIFITDRELSILKSLQRPGYTWRYAKSVAREASLTSEDTEESLRSMRARQLVESGKGSNGEIWAATALGKSVQLQRDAEKV